ncbi:MAG: histidine kinase, partial [Bacteroidota bacterium]|nr:histidine kinase [Bacteroidota bacterium]
MKESCISIRLVIILCTLICYGASVHSQVFPKDEDFNLYTLKDGLPDNNVLAIEQDDQGYIWVGTSSGLSCFDGAHFTNFYKTDDPNVSLGSDKILKLLKRPDGKIYVGTLHGLTLLDPITRQMFTFLVEGEKELSKVSNSYGVLALLPNGDLVAGSGVGITVFNPDMEIQFEYVHYKKEDLGVKRFQFVNSLLPLSNGDCYIFGPEVWLYHASEKRLEHITEPLLGIASYRYMQNAGDRDLAVFQNANDDPHFMIIGNLVTGATGKTLLDNYPQVDLGWQANYKIVSDSIFIFASHRNGLAYGRLNKETLQVEMNPEWHFPDYHSTVTFQDRSGRIWMGTQYGLLGQSFTKQIFQHHPIANLKSDFGVEPYVTAICRFKDHFYIGLPDFGVWKMNLSMKVLEPIDQDRIKWIWNITSWSKDELFIGTQDKWISISPDHPDETYQILSPSGSTLCQFRDRSKNIWAGFYGGIMRYNPVTKEKMIWSSRDSLHFFPNNDAWSITETDSGYIWACGEGFHRWNPVTQIWDRNYRWMPGSEGQEGHSHQIITIGGEDLIFNLMNNGLWKWDAKKQLAEKIPTGNRVFEFVEEIYPDPRPDCYWFILKAGIGFMNIKTGQQRFFNDSNGLPDGEVIDDYYLDPITDTMYIGMDNGVLAFARKDVEFTSKPPRVYLTGVKLVNSGRTVPASLPVTLDATERDFSIEFSSPEYENASYLRYEYKLSNQAWSDLGNNQSVRFANLNAGKYEFQVRAVSPYGAIGDTASIGITILPFYYETWWFKILIVLIVIALIMFWVSWRLRQLRKLEEMRQSIAADLHDEVGASLTSVQILAALAGSDDTPESKKELLSRLDI